MAKVLLFALALTLIPRLASCDEYTPSVCVNALEQIAALKHATPVYMQLNGDERHYLDDADRPAEIARLQEVASSSCSADRKRRAAEEAEARRLHVARSPECAIERDKLAAMERSDSREPADSVKAQRRVVASHCPLVSTRDTWLLQMVWSRP
ncbi:MAG TPA: hypothetical protein VET46_05555 [Steroidobacteraceae bacterium]|nr:hypothetical protein [Steroidobacteraceae bacterium]